MITMCGVLDPIFTLLVQGPVVSFAVDMLKRIKWVKDNPQRMAALLNAAAALLTGLAYCGHDIGQTIAVFVAGFAGSVATHEVASNFKRG